MHKIRLNGGDQLPKPKPLASLPLRKKQQSIPLNPKPILQQPKTANKKGRKGFVIFLLIAVLALGGGFLYWRWNKQLSNSISSTGEKRADACTNILDTKCWTEAFKPQLKQVDGKTSTLIVGVDTRSSGSGSGLMNTDTIMLVTVDHKKKTTRLVSFPRDLYAPYGCTAENMPYKTKINAIYAYGKIYCDHKNGMKTLSATITKITGEQIQYTTLVHLEGVVQAIDKIGGIDVEVEKTFVDVYPYIELPADLQKSCVRSRVLPAYCEFKFTAGKQHLNGEMALVYSRMRQYSSDFERARRQQQVVEATKNKIMGDETPLADKATNLLKVYNSVKKNIEVKLDLEMILASLKLATEIDTDPIEVVIDPNFGGGGIVVKGQGSNFNFSDYSFANVQAKLKFINDNAAIYRDEPTIYAVNRTGSPWTADNPMMQMKNAGYWFAEIISDTKTKDAAKSGVEIVDYTGGKKKSTVEYIRKKFEAKKIKVTIVSSTAIPKTSHGEDVGVYIYDLNAATSETTN